MLSRTFPILLQEETAGYFIDLQVYVKDEDNKAHRPDERDMMPW